MDLVKESKKEGVEVRPRSRTIAHNLQVKLVALSEKDDIEAYLVTFERIMEAYKVRMDVSPCTPAHRSGTPSVRCTSGRQRRC